MGQPRVKWGQIERYFSRRGYEIKGSGGDKMIIAPKTDDPNRKRNVVRVGHKWCGSPGTEVIPAVLQQIRRSFGVSVQDILAG